MAGFPTNCTVLLDDGTGAYPYDVTQYVRQIEGITWNRGRQDELTDNQAGAISVTFDNTDGRFTLGSGTYNIACDQGIRFKIGTTVRWTGKVQSWPVAWPDGSDQFAVAQATGTDELAPLTRRKLYSATVEEIGADTFGTGAALWPLSDDPGNLLLPQAHDVNGVAMPLVPSALRSSGSNLATFAQSLGTPDGAQGVQVKSSTTGVADGLQPMVTSPVVWAPTGFSTLHFEFTYNLAGKLSAPITNVITLLDNHFGLQILLRDQTVLISRDVSDVQWSVNIGSAYNGLHTLAFDFTNSAAKTWMDGVLLDTHAGRTTTYQFNQSGNPFELFAGFTNDTQITMTVGNVSIGPSISSAIRIVAHQTAALTDFLHETPAARITRVAGYVGVPLGTIDSTGDTTCGIANQAGRTALDCINETADADLGNAYINATGVLAYTAGTTFAGLVDSAVDANWFDQGTSFVVDMQNVVNYATGKASSGFAIQGPVFDATSIAQHGRYQQDYEWNVDSDVQALYRTQWKVANYAQPSPRCPTLTADLLTMDATTRATVQAIDVNTFLQVTGLPSQTPGGTSVGFIVVGVTETLTTTEWTVTFNCVLRSTVGAWVLGDATYGVLGTTTKLYV